MTFNPARVHDIAVGTLALTAFCLPLYVIRWHLGPLPTTLLENVVGLTVLAYIGVLWYERRPPRFGTPYDIPIGLLLVAGIIGIVVAPDHARAIGIYRAYFVEAIAVFYIAADVLHTKRDLRTVVIGLVGSGVWMSLGEIATFTYAELHHSLQIGAAPAFLNTSANAVALYLEPPLAFAAGAVLFDETRRLRLIAAACLGVIVLADLLTLSRGGYGSLAVLGAIVVASLPTWRARFITTAAVLASAVLFFSVPLIRARLATVQFSILLRDSLYQQAFHVLAQRPIFGAGISGYPVRAAPFRPPTQTIELYPHNLWLTTWSEIGLLGVVAFGVIFFGLLWRGFRAIPKTKGFYKAVTWGAVGALVLYLVHGMVDSPYWKNDLAIEFWFVAAFAVVAVRSGGASAQPTRPEVGQVGAAKDSLLRSRLH